MEIDIEKAKQEFIVYTEKYDLQNENIKRKQEHSLRVMQISEKLAKMLGLSKEEIQLATLIGLLHDIGRFEQYVRFKNYGVIKEFDHGDYAVEILKKNMRNFIKDDKYDSIILNAIKNHNKYKIEDGLTSKEEFFAKLIRDADKIDILYECEKIFWNGKEEKIEKSILSDEMYNNFKKKKIIRIEKDRNYNVVDDLFITLAYIFDINYNVSYKIIRDEGYIEKIIKRFQFRYEETKEKVDELINLLNKYVEDKAKD